MPIYSLIHVNGCGAPAFHYAATPEVGGCLQLDKAFTILGEPVREWQTAKCSSCGAALQQSDIVLAWFVLESVH